MNMYNLNFIDMPVRTKQCRRSGKLNCHWSLFDTQLKKNLTNEIVGIKDLLSIDMLMFGENGRLLSLPPNIYQDINDHDPHPHDGVCCHARAERAQM